MRKINKKILVTALSLLIIACAFVTILSFTNAAEGDDKDTTKPNDEPSFEVVTIYNIDRIIQNSIDGSDPDFHIVEISSGSFSAMDQDHDIHEVVANVFAKQVINGHRTVDDKKIKAENIDYQHFSTYGMSDSDLELCLKKVSGADLVYLHNDASNYFGKSDNDIPEMLKLKLCSVAVGDYVPFIIDGPITTQESIEENTTSYQNLVTDVFYNYGGRRYTYPWTPKTQDNAGAYFRHETSAYIQIDGKAQKSKWNSVYEITAYDVEHNLPEAEIASGTDAPADGIDRKKQYYEVTGSPETGNPYTIAKVIVINNKNEDGAISKLVKAGLEEFNGNWILEKTAESATEVKDKDDKTVKLLEKTLGDDGSETTPIYNAGTVYKVDKTKDFYSAYVSRNSHPDYVGFEYYQADDPKLNTIDYSQYDLIIVESGVNVKTLTKDNYNLLYGAMMANQHILYDSALVGSGSSNSTTIVKYGDNYEYVCGKVMTSTEVARYSNILVTNSSRMQIYMAANNPDAVKDIADIINYASYRGIGGGNGDSSNTYTVLEIQPAYPIDTQLEQLFTRIDGSKHISGLTDPLAYKYDSETSLLFKDVTARNAATDNNGLPKLSGKSEYQNMVSSGWYYIRNQGTLTDTTTDEISFDGNKSLTSFLDDGDTITSDMLANVTDYYAWKVSRAKIAKLTGLPYEQVNVVHMSSNEFNATKKTLVDNFDAVYIGGDNSALKPSDAYQKDKLKNIGESVYTMYFTKGDAYTYSRAYGSSLGSVGRVQGNDISTLKYKELKEYRDKGMPIIFDKDVKNGWESDTAIDPSSNMYTFINECRNNSYSNVLWAFDYDDKVKIANPAGAYGSTYGGYVTVFRTDETEDYAGQKVQAPTNSTGVYGQDFKQKLKESSQRPKLVITSSPIQYKEGDESTWITNHKLSWNYEVTGGEGFTARLIFDDNANSRFNDDPVKKKNEGNKGTLSTTLGSDFYGVVYWKLEVENSAGLKASTTGCLKIARTDQPKIQINLLQVMPNEQRKTDEQNKATLYLCKECQQSRYVLYGNRYAKLSKLEYDTYLTLSDGFSDKVDFATLNSYPVTDIENQIKSYINNVNSVDSTNYLDIGMPAYGNEGEWSFNITNNLGVHDHKFGIVKYDSDIYVPRKGGSGVDDWNTNWFDEVRDDYNVDMDIIYIDELERIVDDVANVYSNKDTSEISTLRSKYAKTSADFMNAYNGMVKVINGTYKNSESKGGLTVAEKQALQKIMFRKDGFNLGREEDITKADIEAAEKVASDEADDLVKSAATKEGLKEGTIEWDEYVANYWGNVFNLTRSQYEETIKQAELDKIRYSNFETVMDKYAKAGSDVEDFLIDLKASGASLGSSPASAVAAEIDYELSYDTYSEMPFYDLFSMGRENSSNIKALVDYAKVYSVWRDAKIYEQFFKTMYTYYAIYAGVNDAGEANLEHYNCIVFGAAKDFGGQDIDSEDTLDAIIRYINNGGQTMLFYDSLTASSTEHMTEKLGPYFGINNGADTSTTTIVADEPQNEEYKGKILIEIKTPHNDVADSWANRLSYKVDASATEVIVNIEGDPNGNFANDSSKYSGTDNSNDPSNIGNYSKHDINITLNITDPPSWMDKYGYVYVNGVKKGTFTKDSKTVKISSSVVAEAAVSSGGGGGTLNPITLTYMKIANGYRTVDESGSTPMFKYTMYNWEKVAEDKTHTSKDALAFAYHNRVQTNAADQNNEGIVTMYPFSIGANLRVTPTVEGDFTAKVDDENMIVYYSLSGGTQGTLSSGYVADPHDGGNNYFVYQYQPKGSNAGTVTYLGAGFTVITGYKRENNDERRFFINLILNTGRKSTKSTTLDLFDHSSTQVVDSNGDPKEPSTTNAIVKENGTLGYTMTITEGQLPEFSMLVTSESSIDISEVWVYYDLDYDEKAETKDDDYHDNENHPLVYNKTFNKDGDYDTVKFTQNPWVASGYLMYIDENTAKYSSDALVNGKKPSMLKVENNYLKNYNNEYTYLVVKVKDTKGISYFRRIKIIIKPDLYDLT